MKLKSIFFLLLLVSLKSYSYEIKDDYVLLNISNKKTQIDAEMEATKISTKLLNESYALNNSLNYTKISDKENSVNNYNLRSVAYSVVSSSCDYTGKDWSCVVKFFLDPKRLMDINKDFSNEIKSSYFFNDEGYKIVDNKTGKINQNNLLIKINHDIKDIDNYIVNNLEIDRDQVIKRASSYTFSFNDGYFLKNTKFFEKYFNVKDSEDFVTLEPVNMVEAKKAIKNYKNCGYECLSDAENQYLLNYFYSKFLLSVLANGTSSDYRLLIHYMDNEYDGSYEITNKPFHYLWPTVFKHNYKNNNQKFVKYGTEQYVFDNISHSFTDLIVTVSKKMIPKNINLPMPYDRGSNSYSIESVEPLQNNNLTQKYIFMLN